MGHLFFLTFVAVGLGHYWIRAECPHLDSTLEKWSEDRTWDAGKPMDGDSVVISKPILLDESPLDLFSITIEPSGRLVWSPDVAIDLRVSYIWIDGRLDIGSEDCPYEGETNITLTGNRGDYELEVGPKVLLVASGGTLELHGRKKLSWTKLDKTVRKVDNSDALLYDHISDDRGSIDSDTLGMVAYTITPAADDTFTVKDFGVYDLYTKTGDKHKADTERLAQQIENVADGDVFMMATQRYNNVLKRFIPVRAYDAFETLVQGSVTQNSIFREIRRPYTYATIFQKGHPESFQEVKGYFENSIVSWDAPGTQLRFTVFSYGLRPDKKQYENFQITRNQEDPTILDLIDDVTTWQPGDKIVLASTDYNWEQAEEREVIECLECGNKQVKIDSPLSYMHYGEMVEGVVDERGEVALLSRNIVIRGEMTDDCPKANGNCNKFSYDTFGGHVKVLKDFEDVHIEGVELYNVGQQTDLGRYPIHFHMCLDTNYSKPYIRDNSIHHTFARCVTIHGTHHVLVQDNVCYRSLGHSYFLEDGSEMYNTFDGNIAIGTMPGRLIPTDISTPTSFWITNPLTYVRNNVAAGGKHTGYWYIYPIEPLGQSTKLKLLEPWEASKTRLLDCSNNVAHSYGMTGFNMEEHLDSNGNIKQTNYYQPREDPRNDSSPYLPIIVDRITAYKNREENIWLEGGYINLRRSSSADTLVGISIFNTQHRNKHGSLTESVIIGESQNLGEPDEWNGEVYPRSFPLPKQPYYPRHGFEFYKGPQKLKDVWFAGFEKNNYFTSAALSWTLGNGYFIASQSSVENAKFAFDDSADTGNRVYQGVFGEDPLAENNDGDEAVSFRDLDNGVQIMKPDSFTAVNGCVLRPSWKMAMCTEKYAKIRIYANGAHKQGIRGIMVRDDIPSAEMEFDFKVLSGFPVAIGGKYTYTLAFKDKIPNSFYIEGDGIEKDGWVRIGLCIPRDAEFHFHQMGGIHTILNTKKWTRVDSLEALDKDDDLMGTKLYHDTAIGILYFKLYSNLTRSASETRDCPLGLCPKVRFSLINGTAEDSDCRSRLFSKEDYEIVPPELPVNIDVIPANSLTAPDGWGAGPTRPFLDRPNVNGGYGAWTAWSACSQTCGGGLQYRQRVCESSDGQGCEGPNSETNFCNYQPCE